MISIGQSLQKPIDRYIDQFGTPELKKQRLTVADWKELEQVLNLYFI